METKKEFIIGYLPNQDELVEFATTKEADYEAEEWVRVIATSLDEAKDKYDETFLTWQKPVSFDVAKHKQHDASGIEKPYDWLWDKGNGNIYYPVRKLR